MGEKVSLNPAAFVEGGGVWNNLDVRWVNPRFVSDWDYKGKADPVAAFVVDLIDLSDGQMMEPQAWSVGSEFSASIDGTKKAQSGPYLIGPALKKSCNFAILMESIADATPNELKKKLIDTCFTDMAASSFDGLEAHMVRKVVERKGLASNAKVNPKTGKAYEPTGTPVVDIITKFPWDKAKKTPPGAKAGAAVKKGAPAASTKAAATGDAVDARAEDLIVEILGDYTDGITKDDLLSELYAKVRVPKERNIIVALVGDADSEWLGSHGEGKFSYNPDDDSVYPEA